MIYNIAILGASGYTGAELVRLIAPIRRCGLQPFRRIAKRA